MTSESIDNYYLKWSCSYLYPVNKEFLKNKDLLTWLYSKYKTEAQADISLLICAGGGLWIGLFWPNWPLFGDDANDEPDEEKGLFWWNTSCCWPGKTFCDEFGENWFENEISWGECELVSWSRECVLTVGFCKTGAGWRNWAIQKVII